MSRRADGSYSVSSTHFINDDQPFMLFDFAKENVDLNLIQKDLLFARQMASADPTRLAADCFNAAGIVDTGYMSSRVFKKLQAYGVINAQDGTIHTENIDRYFAHHLAIISAYRQKQVVLLLFWWQEECQRLVKLSAERQELKGLMAVSEGQAKDLYAQHLDAVERQIAANPSERAAQADAGREYVPVTCRPADGFSEKVLSAREMLHAH